MSTENPNDGGPDMTGVTITAGGKAETYVADTSEEAAEEVLLAGKFKTPADLEKAYKELQSKLGKAPEDEPAEEAAEEDTEEKPEGDTEEKPSDDADENPYGPVVSKALEEAKLDLEDVRKQYDANEGTLDDETYEALGKAGFPRPMVESYLRGLAATGDGADATVAAQVAAIKTEAGGDEQFAAIQKYIAASYNSADAKAYNDAVQSGDVEQARKAVMAARDRYTTEMGVEAPMNTGGQAQASTPGYPSEAAMMEAMANPRYKKSQAYRDEVEAKIANSTFFRVR